VKPYSVVEDVSEEGPASIFTVEEQAKRAESLTSLTMKMTAACSPKHEQTPTRLHGITSQKVICFIQELYSQKN
jgi:hypothetical protein